MPLPADAIPLDAVPVNQGGSLPPDAIALDNQQTAQEQPRQAKGIIGNTLGAIGSGLMRGSEAILQTEQGATNIVGGALNTLLGGNMAPPSQIFSDTAKDIEDARQKLFGNPDNIAGKVIERVSQIPAIIAMTGAGEAQGILGMSGGLASFAVQNALQAQPRTQGEDIAANLKNVGVAGMQGALFGYAMGKAMRMNPVPGIVVGAGAGAIQDALNGGEPSDILAGAIMGAGMATMSNPKLLAKTLLDDTGLQVTKNVGPDAITKAIEPAKTALGNKVKAGFAEADRLFNAQDRIADLDEQIVNAKEQQKSINQSINDNLSKEQTTYKENMQSLKDEKAGNLFVIGEEKDAKTLLIKNAFETKQAQIQSEVDNVTNMLNTNVDKLVSGVKSGQVQAMKERLSTAYESSLSTIGKAVEQKSPFTCFNVIDFLIRAKQDIINKNYGVTPNIGVTKAIDSAIANLKQGKFTNARTDVGGKSVAGRSVAISNQLSPQIMKQLGITPGVPLSSPIEFGLVKGMVDRIANAGGESGNYEAGILKDTFSNFVGKKLNDAGMDTKMFEKLQQDYGNANGALEALSKQFGNNDYQVRSGAKLFNDYLKGDRQSQNLVKFLQEGTEVGSSKVRGVGNITSTINTLSQKLGKINESMTSSKRGYETAVVKLTQEFADRIASANVSGQLNETVLSLEHKRLIANMQHLQTLIDGEMNKNIELLQDQKRMQKEYLQRKKDLGGFINTFGVAVGAYVYKLGALLRFGGRLLQRNQTGLGKRP